MRHLGDITKINGAEVPIVDIICGGSPCQDLSVAGKRAGLDGERSGLFMEQVRIVKEQRDECVRQLRLRGADFNIRDIKPRYLIWENVPGAFSSNKGEDFRCVLEEFCRIADKTATVPLPEKGKWSNSGCIMGDGWSVAWRVHDSQFWGVPQRRRRISVIGDFGGESAPEILFEREGLSGDIEPSKQEREKSSDPIGNGIKAASNVFGDDVMPTLVSRLETPVGNTQDGFNVISFQERAGCAGGGKGILIQNEKTASLRTATNQSVLTIDEKMGQTYVNEDMGNTLSARDYKQPQAVCYGMDNERRRGVDEFVEQSPTITSRAGTGGNNVPVTINVETEVCVRKYEVDTDKLKKCLRSHRNMTIQEIADKLGRPKTLVEHWFRDDDCFAIPEPNVWLLLKELLGIDTDEFDESIMTFELKPGTYDMSNRIHMGDVSPTLKASSGKEMFCMEVFHCTAEEDKAQTLKARDYKDPQVVAYGIEPGAAKRMNVEGRYWEEKSPTLRAEAGDNQASVVCYGVDGYNQSATEEVSKAITSSATDSDHVPCVTYGLDRASFNQGQNAKFDFSVEEELAPTLVNRGPGGGCNETVGALCARDYKGVGSQYVEEGKLIIQEAGTSDAQGYGAEVGGDRSK